MDENQKSNSRDTKGIEPKGGKELESEPQLSAEEVKLNKILEFKEDFLSDLESIEEMFEVVLPELQKKDEERRSYLDSLTKKERSSEKFSISLNEIDNFYKQIKKLHRGELMFRQSVVVNLVSKFDNFFSNILEICFLENPNWLKSSSKQFSYLEIFDIESIEDFKANVAKKEVEVIMRGSHYNQVQFLDEKLSCGIQKEFHGWKKFLEITERRNLFVHSNGKIVKVYLDNCQKWGIKLNEKIKKDIYISASDTYIRDAINCFYELSIRLVQAVGRQLFPNLLESLDKSLVQDSYELLKEERWLLAEKVCKFALSIPDKFIKEENAKLFLIVNLCISRKNSGLNFDEYLDKINKQYLHPIYQLASAVLQDHYDEAGSLMRNQAILEKFGEREFKHWPLFKEFRKTSIFQKTFKEVFDIDYESNLREETLKEIEAQQHDNTTTETLDEDLGNSNHNAA